METRLSCASCGNRCLFPPSRRWDYACPRCGHLLPRTAAAAPGGWSTAGWASGARTRYLLLLAALFGFVALGVPGLVYGPRVASSAPEQLPRRASLVRLTGGEQRNYAFRIHQLEQDVRRDGTDFDVLRRLGQLHLRLAVCDVDGRGSHLRRARYYLRRAADVAMTSREAQMVRGLIDAANSPNPALDLIGMPGEMGPPPRVDEEVIRMRLGWLEEQIGYRPNSARLLTRLGDNYTALYHALVRGGGRRSGRWPAESSVNDAEEARRLAEHDYGRALQCATTQESRCRALYGIAQLYRETAEPARAATALRRLLALQPNNWFAALEMSRLSQQLGQPEEVARYQALAARWRTPAWM